MNEREEKRMIDGFNYDMRKDEERGKHRIRTIKANVESFLKEQLKKISPSLDTPKMMLVWNDILTKKELEEIRTNLLNLNNSFSNVVEKAIKEGGDIDKAIETMKKIREEENKKYKSPLDEPITIPGVYHQAILNGFENYTNETDLSKMKLAFKQETHFSDIDPTESMLKPYTTQQDLPPSQIILTNPVLGNIVNLNEILFKYENEEKQSFFYYFVDKIEAKIIADALESYAKEYSQDVDTLITKWRNRSKRKVVYAEWETDINDQ